MTIIGNETFANLGGSLSDLLIASTPFILVYEELDGSLVIVHMEYGRQNWRS